MGSGESNILTVAIGETGRVTAVSETYSCCTKLSSQLGRAYNVHGNVLTVVCGHNERRDAKAL